MSLNLFKIIKEGTKAVPATKFAVGIAGMVAIVALIVSLKIDLRLALWGTIILLGLMILLVIFSKLTKTAAEEFKLPVKIFMWAFVILFIAISFMLTSSVFFKFPVNLQFMLAQIDNEKTLDSSSKEHHGTTVLPSKLPVLINDTERHSIVKLPDKPAIGHLNNIKGLNDMFYEYTGDIKDNLPNGTGVAIYTNKLKLQGNFLNGQLYGKGKIDYVNGDRYDGECSGDQANGFGVLVTVGGDREEGYFSNDEMNGEVSITYSDGGTYNGATEDNFLSGHGVKIFSTGTKYSGDFKYDKFSGKGKIVYGTGTLSYGDSYEGDFNNDRFSGIGIYIINTDNGIRYISNCPKAIKHAGQYIAGRKQGLGICVDKNEHTLYKGEFVNDMPTGNYPK